MKIGVLYLILIFALLTGCVDCKKHKRHADAPKPNYIIKVCSLGDTDGSTCVNINAKDYSIYTPYISIKTLDDEVLRYNWEGWAILIRKVD